MSGRELFNFEPGQMVRYLAKSWKNSPSLILDRRSLLLDVPLDPYQDSCNLVDVPIQGMVGRFVGWKGCSAQIVFPIDMRPVTILACVEDFEAVSVDASLGLSLREGSEQAIDQVVEVPGFEVLRAFKCGYWWYIASVGGDAVGHPITRAIGDWFASYNEAGLYAMQRLRGKYR